MIYLETSVALAHIFLEPRSPPREFWAEELVSSRLLEYEIWTRLHARGLTAFRGGVARALIDEILLMELTPVVLRRALEPFPVRMRTLDALHLATIEYLRLDGDIVQIASYDQRMLANARALGIPTVAMG